MLEWRFCSGRSPEWREICRRFSRLHQRRQLQQRRDQRRFSQCSGHLPMQGWYVGLPLDVFFKLQLAWNDFISVGDRNLEIPKTLRWKRKVPARFDFVVKKVHSGPPTVLSSKLAPWKFLYAGTQASQLPYLPVHVQFRPPTPFVLHFCPKCCLTCHFLQNSQKYSK